MRRGKRGRGLKLLFSRDNIGVGCRAGLHIHRGELRAQLWGPGEGGAGKGGRDLMGSVWVPMASLLPQPAECASTSGPLCVPVTSQRDHLKVYHWFLALGWSVQALRSLGSRAIMVHFFIHVFMTPHPSTHPSIHPSTHLPPIHLSSHLSTIHPSTHPPTHLSTIHPAIHPNFYLPSIHLSV